MKVKVGVTVPLVEQDRELVLRLPWFAERNFLEAADLEHAVWIESHTPIAGPAALVTEAGHDGVHALRGALAPRELAGVGGDVRVRLVEGRDARTGHAATDVATTTWRVPLDPGGIGDAGGAVSEALVRDLLLTRAPAATERVPLVVLVVDGSATLAHVGLDWTKALAGVPAGTRIAAFLALDAPVAWHERPVEASKATLEDLASWLDAVELAHGHDPVPTLSVAWDLALGTPGARVVWIHGAYPVVLSQPTALLQAMMRRPDGPTLYAFAAAPGTNRLLEGPAGITETRPVERLADPTADLAAFLARGRLSDGAFTVTPSTTPWDGAVPTATATPQLTRLAVARWIEGLPARDADGERARAIAEATQLGLVTTLTGAVVLEKKEQYVEQGLTPVLPGSVPSIPEPRTWALLAVGAAVLLAAARRARSDDRGAVRAGAPA